MRVGGTAAPTARAVPIDSNQGSATRAPSPLRAVRRETRRFISFFLSIRRLFRPQVIARPRASAAQEVSRRHTPLAVGLQLRHLDYGSLARHHAEARQIAAFADDYTGRRILAQAGRAPRRAVHD